VLKLVLRRLVSAIPTLIGVTILTFGIVHAIPGDPAQVLLFGANPTPEQVESLRQELGLDRALPVQYLDYIGQVAQGNLGESFQTSRSVSDEIGQRLPSTLELAGAGLFVMTVIALPLGAIAAARPGSWFDRTAMGFAVIGVAVPYFWLALILTLVFAVELGWFPAIDDGSLKSLVLPAFSLGIAYAAIAARLLRNSLIEVSGQPYIQAARAKGLSGAKTFRSHVVKNAAIPVTSIFGLQFGHMLAGAVVIETIFGRPGIGAYLVTAIQSKDIPVVQGVILIVALAYVLINLLVDLTVGLLNPKVRASWARE
jgi:peptide/nickel transport system permease protein